jgi:hypothetical protein
MAELDRIARLAKLIDSDINKDHYLRLTGADVASLRRKGAIQLHSICALKYFSAHDRCTYSLRTRNQSSLSLIG